MDATEIEPLRKALGLSRDKMARNLGITVQTIFRWEHGQVKPSPLAMERLEQLKRELEGKQSPEDIVPSKGELVFSVKSSEASSFARAHVDLDLDSLVQKHRPGCILDLAVIEPRGKGHFEITRIVVKPKGS